MVDHDRPVVQDLADHRHVTAAGGVVPPHDQDRALFGPAGAGVLAGGELPPAVRVAADCDAGGVAGKRHALQRRRRVMDRRTDVGEQDLVAFRQRLGADDAFAVLERAAQQVVRRLAFSRIFEWR
jgi:hypothetical protein